MNATRSNIARALALRVRVALALVALPLGACTSAPAGTTITNVRIVDGTGAPAVAGAVRFVGDSIVAVGEIVPARGDSVIDGGGLVLAPGFIDTHSHHGGGLLETPDALGAVSQGITTIVAGADGGHPYPLAARIDTLAKSPRPSTSLSSPATERCAAR